MKHFIINIMPTSIITKEEEISIYVQGTASNASSSRYTNNTVSKNLSLQLLNYSILTLNQKTTFPRCFSDEKKKKYMQQSSIRLSKRSVSCFKNKLARFWSICPTRFFGKGWIIYYHASKNTRNVYKHQSRVSKIYVYDLWICPTLEESNCWSNRG